MWTDPTPPSRSADDWLQPSRVQQMRTDLHKRVMGLNLDVLLRWTLVVNVVLVSVFSALTILQSVWGMVSTVVMTAWGVIFTLVH